MNSYKVGQKVVFLNERGGGVVVSIQGEHIGVQDETGFTRHFSPIEIAPVVSEDYGDKVPDHEETINQELEYSNIGLRKSKVSGRRKPIEVWELDLHVEELMDSHAGFSNTEIIRRQMNVFKDTYRNARKNNIRKMIVIHGVGEGVLKSNIIEYLNTQDGVEFYDADFREYGKGATEILLQQLD